MSYNINSKLDYDYNDYNNKALLQRKLLTKKYYFI